MTEKKVKKDKIVNSVGTRKRAVARAVARRGKGKVLINAVPLESYPEIPKLIMSEPIMIAKEIASTVDIHVNVKGGGAIGQADAVRQAVAKALVGFSRGLRSKFLTYDRHMLVADSRRTEPHKPSRSKQGARTHKQRSKR